MTEEHTLVLLVVLLVGLLGAVGGGILQRSASPAAKTIRAGFIAFGSTVAVALLLLEIVIK